MNTCNRCNPEGPPPDVICNDCPERESRADMIDRITLAENMRMTKDHPTLDLGKLLELCEGATAGPWTYKCQMVSYPECSDQDWLGVVLAPNGKDIATIPERFWGPDGAHDQDAQFIAAANPATVKALVLRLQEQDRLLDIAREGLAELRAELQASIERDRAALSEAIKSGEEG